MMPFAEAARLMGARAVYRMWGLECALCSQPLHHMSVFEDRMEMWHSGQQEFPNVCVRHFAAEERKPRPKKGQLHNCPVCSTPHTDAEELCRSCRNQSPLFPLPVKEREHAAT